MGWFDVPLVRQALRFNGADSMAIMKLDVLDSLESINICTGYRVEGKLIDVPPAMTIDWSKVQAVYETLPGWKKTTKDISKYEDLPIEAQAYLQG